MMSSASSHAEKIIHTSWDRKILLLARCDSAETIPFSDTRLEMNFSSRNEYLSKE